MQLIITNKTFVPQIIWISSPDYLDEELLVLKSRETRCVKRNERGLDVSVWDRSSEYRLGGKDRKRMASHFGIQILE